MRHGRAFALLFAAFLVAYLLVFVILQAVDLLNGANPS